MNAAGEGALIKYVVHYKWCDIVGRRFIPFDRERDVSIYSVWCNEPAPMILSKMFKTWLE